MTRNAAAKSWAVVDSPLGHFAVGGSDEAVLSVLFPDEVTEMLHDEGASRIVFDAATQLDEYLSGMRTKFTVPTSSMGTEFQEDVWGALASIPYGTVRTYGWVAEQIGTPTGPRAVGQALGKNPIPIFRPCHRVVAAYGLGGFGGGTSLKRSLLALEGLDDYSA